MASVSLNNPTVNTTGYKTGLTAGACTTSSPLSTTYIWFGGNGFNIPPFVSYGYRAWIEWDISSIPDSATITSVIFKYKGIQSNSTDGEINPMANQPTTRTVAQNWTDAGDGASYVDPFNVQVGNNKQVDLGANAVSDLEDNLADDWFAIGFASPADECPNAITNLRGIICRKEDICTPDPTLYVEYTVPSGAKASAGSIAPLMRVEGMLASKIPRKLPKIPNFRLKIPKINPKIF